MNVLLALLPILALTLADECLEQAKSAHECIGNEVKTAFEKAAPVLKNLKTELDKCFNDDCPRPELPPGFPPGFPQGLPQGLPQGGARPELPQGARPAFPPPPQGQQLNLANGPVGLPALPAEFADCGKDLKEHFLKCFPLPQDLAQPHPAAAAQPQGAAGFGPGAQGHPFQADPKQIGPILLKLCKNNANAVKGFLKCALDAVNKTQAWQALGAVVLPEIVACPAAKKCASSVSADCVAQFQQKQKQFCQCANSTLEFAKQDAQCQSARDALKSKFEDAKANFQQQHQENVASAASNHFILPHPQLDICGASDPCTDLQAKLLKFKALLQTARENGLPGLSA